MNRGHLGSIHAEVSRKAYPAAWITFVDPATIQDSFNVSSLTNLATGRYQITFARPFGYAAAATGYAVTVVSRNATSGGAPIASIDQVQTEGNAYNVNSVSVHTANSTAAEASTICSVIVWGL